MIELDHKQYLLRRRVFTESEWDAAEGNARLYMHLIEPHKWHLTQPESKKLDDLKAVWKIICKEPVSRRRITKVEAACDVGNAQAFCLIKEAKEFWGELLEIDVWLERRLSYDRMMGLYEHALKAEEYGEAAKILDKAQKILLEIEKNAPKSANQYQPIQITTNPAMLGPQEYAEFAELPTALPQPETERILRGA